MTPNSFPNQWFWMKVYIAAIRRDNNNGPEYAKQTADRALKDLKETIHKETQ